MRPLDYPDRQDSYSRLTDHLLNSDSPLNYSLEYLLENYDDRAVPALLQALPRRPPDEQVIILEALGKLGDLRAIVPVCALLYERGNTIGVSELTIINSLRNLVYYCTDTKKAVTTLIETVVRYPQCADAITAVLREQKNKYTIKRVYKKLFKHDSVQLKKAAITIMGEEDDLTEYRIRYLKKMLYKLSDPQLREPVILSLKLLISRKRCMRLCSKRGYRFDAFFRRPDSYSYDCCCLDRNNKRVLIKGGGELIANKTRKPAETASPGQLPKMLSTGRRGKSLF